MKTLDLRTKARYCGYILLVAGLISCSKTPTKIEGCGKWHLGCYYDNGWSNSNITCDSLQMLSSKEAYVWNNGAKTKIVGKELRPWFVPCN